MTLLQALKARGGCSGGVSVYFLAREAARLGNLGRPDLRIAPATLRRLRPLFRELDLERVRYKERAALPANWLRGRFEAMTFGYRIYFRQSGYERDPAKMRVLVHELVHVDQVRRRGDSERAFACDYGRGYLEAGSYRDHPLEREAREFARRHPVLPAG